MRFSQQLAPANKYNQIIIDDVRISVISPKIIRVEKSSNGFIDNRTPAVYCRDFYKQKASISIKGKVVSIVTENHKYLIDTTTLKYRAYIDNNEVFVDDRQNLLGTVRTLDGNNGYCKLPNGLMSKSGLTVLDDSKSCLLNEDGTVLGRSRDYIDFYILAFGRQYLDGLKEFYKLCGSTPVIPKYALGNWWSRYHAYTDSEYLQLMDEFIKKDIPFTVSTVDMDWHIVKNVPKDVPNVASFGRGWTGYTFEKELFPDYKCFLNELHNRNLKVALNLHPKDGVRYYEKQYEQMAVANGIDPKTKRAVEFNLLDTTFRDSYFDILHHPYENDGVDVWWIDWQQGTKSKMDGVDPLWLLNHYHYLDINRQKRGIILSRYSGIGSHRYPLGFSGDTIVCWNSLKLQPYFTLCSSNVGYSWWSHDIGGHMLNRGNNELYLRWLQLGCFLPINRLHSTNTTLSKEPWLYEKVEKEAIDILRFRHSLIPFIYSASIVNNRQGVPLCSPMYYFYDEPNAYKKKYHNEYIFASQLLVCPAVKPIRFGSQSTIDVWFPEGNWVNIFNGKKYKGNRTAKIKCPLDEYPVFSREGSFIPMLKRNGNSISYKKLTVKVFLGSGEYELLDDNGSVKFSVNKSSDGYHIVAHKIGNIDVSQIEYELVGYDYKNIAISLDNEDRVEVIVGEIG